MFVRVQVSLGVQIKKNSMKKFRFGVFETNSSSTHSVTIRGEGTLVPESERLSIFPLDDMKNIIINLDDCEFGWELEFYRDPWNKLKYLIMMVVETECNECKNIDDIYETEGFKLIQNEIPNKIVIVDNIWELVKFKDNYGHTRSYLSHNGYIDHQSYEGYPDLKSFLDYYHLNVKTFVFNDKVELITDNDNH